MKKNLVFLLMAFLTLNFVACSDDDDNDPVTIEGRGFNIDQTFNVTNKRQYSRSYSKYCNRERNRKSDR